MLTFGSLFSGIGGLDLGLERAGWRCLWQVEIDPFRLSVLEKHWPEVKRYSDVREVDFSNVESVNLIAGGFPCQPVSTAGKMLGQQDERWLWPEFIRAVRAVRPRFVLVENVPGLLVRGMGDVLSDLAACGYDAEWQMFPAAAFGAPHVRARVFIVAYTHSWRRQMCGHIPEGQAIVFSRRFVVAAMQAHRGEEWWSIEPNLERVVYGFPGRVDRRVMALGDAVVPQVAEFVGRLLLRAAELWC